MKPFFLCANWKLNKTCIEISDYLDELLEEEHNENIEVILFPSTPYLGFTEAMLGISEVKVGCQHVSAELEGAYTGETSLRHIEEFCTYALVGHSERRHIYGETDDIISRKMQNFMVHTQITPILCIGEPRAIKDAGDTLPYLKTQLTSALKGYTGDIIIAYEPCWAISDGSSAKRTPTPEEVREAAEFIQETASGLLNSSTPISVLYGGSVNESNAKSFCVLESIDGFLIGGAALDAEHFVGIIDIVESNR